MSSQRLIECLKILGYSQRGFSLWAGLGTDTVRNWARGKSKVPNGIAQWLEDAVKWNKENAISNYLEERK